MGKAKVMTWQKDAFSGDTWRCWVEMGQYIENIVDISVSYHYFRYWFFRYIDIMLLTSEISLIFLYFVIHFPTFNINLKTELYE